MASVNPTKKLRVFLIPFFATGHIIPISELARLMSAHPNVETTLFLTPANADLIRASLDPSVNLLLYPFPSAALGLPPGAENIAAVPASDATKIDKATTLVQSVIDPILHDLRPDAIVADFQFWWALQTAKDLNIPCLNFIVVGAFPQLVLGTAQDAMDREDSNADVTLSSLPGRKITIPRSEFPQYMRRDKSDETLKEIIAKSHEAATMRFGAIVNTFYDLEPEYCEHFRKLGWFNRSWFVGPVALSSVNGVTPVERSVPCMTWLDGQKPGSVVYVCFGSWCHFSHDQLRELALGLEASKKPFLWVVRGDDDWLPDGFEERVNGMLVRGWAPQVEILKHASIGAFLTHCGWNSVLEAAAAGVPMLTWPLVVEQFFNERLVVEVMGAGARVWDGFRSTEEAERVVVPGTDIGKAVAAFMEDGGSEVARKKAREYAVKAEAAMSEGGTSKMDLKSMIDELMEVAGMRGAGEVRNGKIA